MRSSNLKPRQKSSPESGPPAFSSRLLTTFETLSIWQCSALLIKILFQTLRKWNNRRSIVRAARMPQPTSNQPTNRAPNESTKPIFAQKCDSGGQKWRFLGQTSLLFSFGTYIGTFFALFSWSGMAPNGTERPIYIKNDQKGQLLGQIWPLLGQNPNYLGR